MRVIEVKRKKNTIFRQFIFTFMSILAPVILFGLVLIVWQTNVIQTQIEENAAANVNYGINRLEAQISMVKRLQNNLINDRDLSAFLRSYDKVPVYEYYPMINDIIDRITVVKEGNECIYDVGIYFKDIGISVSCRNGYKELADGEYESISSKLEGDISPIFGDDNELYTLLEYSFVKEEGKTEYIIKIDLSQKTLFQEYLLKDVDSDNYVFLYDHSEKELKYLSKEGVDQVAAVISPYMENEKKKQEINYNGNRYLVVSGYSVYLNQSVVQCIPMTKIIHVQNQFYFLLVVYLIFSLILALFFPYSVKRIVNKPIYQLIEAFKDVEKEDLKTRIAYHAADEFDYLYGAFNHMVERLEHLIDENYKSKLYAQKAEMKQMQAQISPHFLYNTYFMLQRMIMDEDLEYAVRLTKHLGVYMEYITHNFQEEVSLEKEVEHMQSYLEIQAMRFENRMHVHIQELPNKFAKVIVPRLILQPVIENYLKYGYEVSGEEGDFFVTYEEWHEGLCIVVSGGCAYIEEQKFGDLRELLASEENTVEVTGLINIHRRLRIKFGKDSGICLKRDEKGLLITKLMIGYKAEDKNVSNISSR